MRTKEDLEDIIQDMTDIPELKKDARKTRRLCVFRGRRHARVALISSLFFLGCLAGITGAKTEADRTSFQAGCVVAGGVAGYHLARRSICQSREKVAQERLALLQEIEREKTS